MNGNNANNSKCSHTVLSKYFANSPVMDESLSEFKEKKQGYSGPKNSQKPVASKGRSRKPPKKIRGQKDIRIALKSKKNELLAYAKEFDEVCKQSGVDVDTEQLQLAIALSKSIESEGNQCSSSQDQPLSVKDRTRRIRTTLQEYGFTVPEIKTLNNKRQKKKYRKNYKLLQSTAAEKQQIVSDKYSQVLFENVCYKPVDQNICFTDNRLYYLSTHVSYMELKINNVLYVDELIPKSSSNGNLLRDWSGIPGRPPSPKISKNLEMNFSEIECSQEELDIVLSGTLKSAKHIVHNKAKSTIIAPSIMIDCTNEDTEAQSSWKNENKPEKLNTTLISNEMDYKDKLKDASSCSLITLDRIRSKSPDIFDDEVSEVWNNSKTIIDISKPVFKESNIEINFTNNDNGSENNDGVTKICFGNKENEGQSKGLIQNKPEDHENDNRVCVVIEENIEHVKGLTEINDKFNLNKKHLSVEHNVSENNFTRRNSNDFMEITECIRIKSQENSDTILRNENKTRRISNDLMEITDCVDKIQPIANVEVNIDLTQNSDENNDVTLANAVVNGSMDKVVDLSQSSHSEDELPFVQISGTNNHSLDDTIILNSNEIINNDKPITPFVHEGVILVEQNQISPKDNFNIDLTQTPPSPSITKNKKPTSQSFYDEFIHNHSDDTSKETLNKSSHSDLKPINHDNLYLSQSNLETEHVNKDAEIDLTQSSNSSDGSKSKEINNSLISTPAKSIFGKADEVSIDYDDLFDNVAQELTNMSKSCDSASHKSVSYDIIDENDVNMSTHSKSSQAFHLSDKEFEYSLNQSKIDCALEVDFGGISALDNMSDVKIKIFEKNTHRRSLNDNNSMNMTLSESYLPPVSMKGYYPTMENTKTDIKSKPSDDGINGPCAEFLEASKATPRLLAKDNVSTVETPKGSEYIIKTDQVTPMLDFASMSTPERNSELDKYGLKPFKRKRAIQLLTHLYNQTHPVVEMCQGDMPSPSKRMKHSSQLSPIISRKSPNKCLKSPRKIMKSPTKCSESETRLDCNEDVDLYEVTNEVPDLRDVACSEEDWVFQKREKAKLQSCRVPLHIAFHNYVSCRRKLREGILKYEPVNIDVIHKGLVASGYRYDPKELLRYMDKRCITVKTADNNSRNNR